MTKHGIRFAIVALAMGAAVSAVTVASAQHRPVMPERRPQANFSIRLEDESGRELPSFRHAGRTWVLGETGERYVVVAQNPTGERVEVVVSVDGRDVLSGQVANFRRHRGYLVPAFGTVRIEGFRRSLDDVASFRFSDPEWSYSARLGTPQNVGVIGAAFFRERPEPSLPVEDEIASRPDRANKRATPAPLPARPRAGAGAARRTDPDTPSDSRLGTEWGETRTSPVRQVSFERASNTPDRVVTLRYDDAAALEARGIDVFRRDLPRPLPRTRLLGPEAFPDSRFSQSPP